MKRFLNSMVMVILFGQMPIAFADVIGGKSVGWVIDLEKIPLAARENFKWDFEYLRTDFSKKPSTTRFTTERNGKGAVVTNAIAVQEGSQKPAFFSIVEIHGETTLEDIKKLHYTRMSGTDGWASPSCKHASKGAESCAVWLHNHNPAKIFFAMFYQWKIGDRTFVMVVRNNQPIPDQKTPEDAMNLLISSIEILGD